MYGDSNIVVSFLACGTTLSVCGVGHSEVHNFQVNDMFIKITTLRLKA
ncbi:hypothetical protein SAMN06265379_1256, partial [Saccharicrinis carchari]